MCPGLINPSIFLTDKKSGGGPLFRVKKTFFAPSPITATMEAILYGLEKNIFFHRYFPLTYNGISERVFWTRSGGFQKYILWKRRYVLTRTNMYRSGIVPDVWIITPSLITASINGIFNGLRRNIFSALYKPLYLSKGHEKAGCPNEKYFICKIFRIRLFQKTKNR